MVLESTMIIVDDSDFMRNGDYIPSRIDAQADAVTLVCQSKRQSHPENAIGLITLSEANVLLTLSTDLTKLYAKLHAIQPKGDTRAGAKYIRSKPSSSSSYGVTDLGRINFETAIKVAHLALRHRLSKNHKMRIVVFVGSVVTSDEKDLERLGKRLKKEKVSIDVVNFGELEANRVKLTTLVNAANSVAGSGSSTTPGASNSSSGGSSHLVSVPPCLSLRDSLISSPIIVGEDGRGAVPLGNMDFGLDPNEDPELLLALRVSLEDQRHRQENHRQIMADIEGAVAAADDLAGGMDAAASGGSHVANSEEEAQLQRLLLQESAAGRRTDGGGMLMEEDLVDFNAMTEDEQIAYALAMSMQQPVGPSDQAQTADKEEDKPVPMETDVIEDAAKPDDEGKD